MKTTDCQRCCHQSSSFFANLPRFQRPITDATDPLSIPSLLTSQERAGQGVLVALLSACSLYPVGPPTDTLTFPAFVAFDLRFRLVPILRTVTYERLL